MSDTSDAPARVGAALLATEISRSYRVGHETSRVLDQVTLGVATGEFVCVFGPSGSGKSTLLRVLGILDLAYDGRLEVNGVDPKSLKVREVAQFRARNCSFIFQDFRLLEGVNISTNVEAPLHALGVAGTARRQRAAAALDLVGLAKRSKSLPSEISGGERQRVAIARALTTGTHILLCDEPTGSLNRSLAREIWDLLSSLHKEFGKTLVVATHDEYGAQLADRVVKLENGKLTRESP